uniref:Putative conserved secreted protein n=1 Tax=Ixodes ricinus TaxID=34613 RepID=V5ID45_IXORI
MLLILTLTALLAGISGQSDDDANAYVDKVIKDELPAELKYLDPLKLRPFKFHLRQHPFGWVSFCATHVTGLGSVQRSGDCGSYGRSLPRRAFVGCNITVGDVEVRLCSSLKYGRNLTEVHANATFSEVRGRLYFSVGAWKAPSARAYPELGSATTVFSGLDDTPETHHLRLGYQAVARDLLAVAVERHLSEALTRAAHRVLFPL